MTELPQDMAAYNRQFIADFRANGGAGGRAILLLTTTGARTGLLRTTPMMYLRIDDHTVVMASNAGAEHNPDWYHNLVANPAVTVELEGPAGVESYDTKAVVPQGDERDRLWAKVIAAAPFFADHQAQVARTIPVVCLDQTVDRPT